MKRRIRQYCYFTVFYLLGEKISINQTDYQFPTNVTKPINYQKCNQVSIEVILSEANLNNVVTEHY